MKTEINETTYLINDGKLHPDTLCEFIAVGTLVVGGFCTGLAASYKEVGIVNAIYIGTGVAAASLAVGVVSVALKRHGLFGCVFGNNQAKVSDENDKYKNQEREAGSSPVRFTRDY